MDVGNILFQLQPLCKYYRETKQHKEKKGHDSHGEEKEGDVIDSPARMYTNTKDETESHIVWEA